jgi:hypothetical protein
MPLTAIVIYGIAYTSYEIGIEKLKWIISQCHRKCSLLHILCSLKYIIIQNARKLAHIIKGGYIGYSTHFLCQRSQLSLRGRSRRQSLISGSS